MIDHTINLRIDFEGRTREVELRGLKGSGKWDVVLSGGKIIGEIERSSYTYSPPLSRGSRVAREHRQVKSWRCRLGRDLDTKRGLHRKTRKEALVELLSGNAQRERLVTAALAFVRANPNATFRIRRGGEALDGTLVNPHPASNLILRRPNGPDERILFREVEDDQPPCLEVSASEGDFVPFANPLHEFSRESAT